MCGGEQRKGDRELRDRRWVEMKAEDDGGKRVDACGVGP